MFQPFCSTSKIFAKFKLTIRLSTPLHSTSITFLSTFSLVPRVVYFLCGMHKGKWADPFLRLFLSTISTSLYLFPLNQSFSLALFRRVVHAELAISFSQYMIISYFFSIAQSQIKITKIYKLKIKYKIE